MKFLLIGLFFWATLSSAIEPKFTWVNVLNKEIMSGNGKFGIDVMDFDDRTNEPFKLNTCSIGSSSGSFKSSLKIIGQLKDNEYIFEYSREGVTYGAPCPSGVFFKAPLEEVLP